MDWARSNAIKAWRRFFGQGLVALLAAAVGTIGWRRAPRRRLAFGLGFAVVVLAATIAGCGSSGGASSGYTGTPRGSASFTVMAQSGSTTVSTPVSVTIQ